MTKGKGKRRGKKGDEGKGKDKDKGKDNATTWTWYNSHAYGLVLQGDIKVAQQALQADNLPVASVAEWGEADLWEEDWWTKWKMGRRRLRRRSRVGGS